MPTRHAACSCGQLKLAAEGDPLRVSICHCLACQRRTGSVFGAQARFARDRVVVEGRSTQYVRVGDSGGRVTFHFCPECGATVYYHLAEMPDTLGIPVGAFADPGFPAPKISIYEERMHAWVALPDGIEHLD
ncbi:MAG TPA: GFA family protein [Paucimonas sp.]|nr:GFA family protein [Paucimonas sp.]